MTQEKKKTKRLSLRESNLFVTFHSDSLVLTVSRIFFSVFNDCSLVMTASSNLTCRQM